MLVDLYNIISIIFSIIAAFSDVALLAISLTFYIAQYRRKEISLQEAVIWSITFVAMTISVMSTIWLLFKMQADRNYMSDKWIYLLHSGGLFIYLILTFCYFNYVKMCKSFK